MHKYLFTASLWLAFSFSVIAQFKYETVPNDPMATRIYKLKNGLKVYLSLNQDEPRITTKIAVRAGSKNDPSDCTGLAHYLEHMVFKGTSKIGTKDWEKESAFIQQISKLYEEHKNTADLEAKRKIYTQIDSISQIAASYAVPNEYDKMISSLGASGTNAYTSDERTVYVNEIPSNELEKWLRVESERFSELTLRLFHTELEAVYEEYNRMMDKDFSRAFLAFNELAISKTSIRNAVYDW
jgi:zinc protease